MLLQRRKWSGRTALSVIGAAIWLSLAACGATPAAPATPGSSDAFTVLSQSSRLASARPNDTPAPAGPELMSAAQARAAAPFVFGLPAWAPPGFQLQGQAEVITPSAHDDFASVSLTWQNAQGAAIELLISQGSAVSNLAGAGGSAEALQIGGQPASLRRQTGFGADRLALTWTSGPLTYRLAAENRAATRDDLVRMAQSVP